MMKSRARGKEKSEAKIQGGVTAVSVCGFKCIAREQEIEIAPVTILAGANSSGKSSMMQPLLLLKQTLQAQYDPGPLLLSGPDVVFKSAKQLLSRWAGKEADCFSVGVSTSPVTVVDYFKYVEGKGFKLAGMAYPDRRHRYEEGMSPDAVAALAPEIRELADFLKKGKRSPRVRVTRNRCFLEPNVSVSVAGGEASRVGFAPAPAESIRKMIHVPALRGSPRERVYPIAPVRGVLPGVFENYMASIVAHWQEEDHPRLRRLNRDLQRLGLTSRVVARRISDTEINLRVGRRPHGGGKTEDLVSIADAGYGVSQVLPVLVALHTAVRGQLVYIEEPEIHLHPRAQVSMAAVLADAAARGVRTVAETHSALLILGLQTLVAEGALGPDSVRLHWFRRTGSGITRISSAGLDSQGGYGDWPEDFADVELLAHGRFLDAER